MDKEDKRYVVVSSNNNPDYLFFAPYVEKAWNKLGWTLVVMITDGVDPKDLKLQNEDTIIIKLPYIASFNDVTLAQVSRLYAANYLPKDALIMTSDMDLIPLSDYWNPSINDITIYGFDLTWRSTYPMGYIAMSGKNWKIKMGLTLNTERDILMGAATHEIRSNPFSYVSEERWGYDQDLITKILKPFENELTFIDRGQIKIGGADLATGRIDRYKWEESQQQETFIDMHCENLDVYKEENMNKFLTVFNKFYEN